MSSQVNNSSHCTIYRSSLSVDLLNRERFLNYELHVPICNLRRDKTLYKVMMRGLRWVRVKITPRSYIIDI